MRLLSRVSQHMTPQVLIADERLATNTTLVRAGDRFPMLVEAPGGAPRGASTPMTTAALARVVGTGSGGHY